MFSEEAKVSIFGSKARRCGHGPSARGLLWEAARTPRGGDVQGDGRAARQENLIYTL